MADEYWAPMLKDFVQELRDSCERRTSARAVTHLVEQRAREAVAKRRAKLEEGKVGELTLSKMIRLMIERQPKLLERFHELDPEGTTKVPRKKFVQVLNEECGECDWLKAIQFLKISEKVGKIYIVDYDEVLTRYRVVVHISSMGFVGQVLSDIMEALQKKGERIDE